MKLEIENGINHLINNDKILKTIIKKNPKCNLKRKRNYFNALVKSIINQQLSIRAAESIYNRFSQILDDEITAEKIIAAPDQKIRSAGLSNAKTKYVRNLSQAVAEGSLKFKGINKLSNEEIISSLTRIKGIGVWSAHMFLIFTLGRLNILPTGDLGIRRAIMLNYNLEFLPDDKKIHEIAKKNNWYPYESIAAWYLWKSLE